MKLSPIRRTISSDFTGPGYRWNPATFITAGQIIKSAQSLDNGLAFDPASGAVNIVSTIPDSAERKALLRAIGDNGVVIQTGVTFTGHAVGGEVIAPEAPHIMVLRGPLARQLTILWQDGYDGGASITSRTIQVTGIPGPVSVQPGEIVITLPADATMYELSCFATNSVGAGEPAIASARTPAVPDAPMIHLQPGDGQIILTLNDGSDNGCKISAYQIYSALPDQTLGLFEEVEAPIVSISIPTPNGVTRQVAVAAVNDVGEGTLSGTASAIPFGLPGRVIFLTATLDGANVVLDWEAPLANGGSEIIDYQIQVSALAPVNWEDAAEPVVAPATEARVPKPPVSSQYRVLPRNARGVQVNNPMIATVTIDGSGIVVAPVIAHGGASITVTNPQPGQTYTLHASIDGSGPSVATLSAENSYTYSELAGDNAKIWSVLTTNGTHSAISTPVSNPKPAGLFRAMSFDGASGTTLIGTNGSGGTGDFYRPAWLGGDNLSFQVQDNCLAISTPGQASWIVCDLGQAYYTVDLEWKDGVERTAIGLAVTADANNVTGNLQVSFTRTGLWTFGTNLPTTTQISYAALGRNNLKDGSLLTVQRHKKGANDYVRIFCDNINLTASINGGLGYDVTAQSGKGTRFGFRNSSLTTGNTAPYKVFGEARFRDNALVSVIVNSIESTTIGGMPYVQVTGTCNGTTGHTVAAVVLLGNGEVRSTAMATADVAVDGSFSIVTPMPENIFGITDAMLKIAASNQPEAYTLVPLRDFVIFAVKQPFIGGINDNFIDIGWPTNNLIHNFKWTVDTGTSGIKTVSGRTSADVGEPFADRVRDSLFNPSQVFFVKGQPTILPAGWTLRLTADYSPPNVPSEVYGSYDVEHTPGLQWAIGLNGKGVFVEDTNYRDRPGGKARINFTAINVGQAIQINITGGLPANPNDLYFRMYKVGISPAEKARFWRPAVRSWLATLNCRIVRFMSMSRANRVGGDNRVDGIITDILPDNCITRRSEYGAQPLVHLFDLAQHEKIEPWYNFGDLFHPDLIRTLAARFRDEVPADVVSNFEPPNESWNYAMGYQFGSLLTNVVNFSNCSVTLNEGDYVIGSTTGFKAFVAKQVITSGSIADGNASGYFIIVNGWNGYSYLGNTYAFGMSGSTEIFTPETFSRCDANGNILNNDIGTVQPYSARHINFARRGRWIYELIDGVYGPGNRHRWRFHLPWQSNQDAIALAMWNEGGFIDFENFSPGTGMYPGSNEVFNYLNNQFWTKADRDLFYDNPTAAIDALVATFSNSRIPTWLGFHKKFNKLWTQYLFDHGKLATHWQFASYEHAPMSFTNCLNWPSLKYSNGNVDPLSLPLASRFIKGRTSGVIGQIQGPYTGDPAVTVIDGGSFPAGTAAGFYSIRINGYGTAGKGNGDETKQDFINGEILDIGAYDGTTFTPVALNIATVTDGRNLRRRFAYHVAHFQRGPIYAQLWHDWLEYLGTNVGGRLVAFSGPEYPATDETIYPGNTINAIDSRDGGWSASDWWDVQNQEPLVTMGDRYAELQGE